MNYTVQALRTVWPDGTTGADFRIFDGPGRYTLPMPATEIAAWFTVNGYGSDTAYELIGVALSELFDRERSGYPQPGIAIGRRAA